MNIRFILSVLFSVILFAGCKPRVPSKYISPSDMEDIIYDYCIAQGVIASNSTPYEKKKCDLYVYKKEILKKYGYSEALYDSSMVYYMGHAKHLYDVYENVIERLGNDAVAMGAAASDLEKFGNVNAMSDTTNIWNERSIVIMSQFPPYNRLDFNIKADSTYKEGDRLMLDFDNKFIYQDGSHGGTALIAVKYDNDSVVERKTHISSTLNYTINIPAIEGRKIKEIRGFFYHTKKLDASLTTLKLMVINNIRLIRFHKEKSESDSIKNSISTDTNTIRKQKDSITTNAF